MPLYAGGSFPVGDLQTLAHHLRLFVRREQYKKDIKLKQNISFDTCFFHFRPIYDSRNLLEDYVYVMAVSLLHNAYYRPEFLFKDR